MNQDVEWSVVTTPKLFAVSLFAIVVFLFHSSKQWVPILDTANLMFHEAGHPIFGLFGDTLQWVGGTLGQLAFPAVTMVSFWNRKETTGFAICSLWFFENFLNIARYMADARTQLLPLLGGGVHDWAYLFGTWQVLHLDTKIASFVRFLGWVGILTVLVWFGFVWFNQSEDRQSYDPQK